jgi:hypothetical protein
LLRPFARNRVCKFSQHLFVDRRLELQ